MKRDMPPANETEKSQDDFKVIRCGWCQYESAADFRHRNPRIIEIRCPSCGQWLRFDEGYEIVHDSNEPPDGKEVVNDGSKEKSENA